MKKRIIVCNTTSEQEIIQAARNYFLCEDFEVQDVVAESGEIGLQARKSSWLRNCSGTSYALQVLVKKQTDNTYVITAGWGEWFKKGTVAFVATFVAFGFLIIPTLLGMANQSKLPDRCLNYVSSRIAMQNSLCQVYAQAK
jgi:hypothetical protein